MDESLVSRTTRAPGPRRAWALTQPVPERADLGLGRRLAGAGLAIIVAAWAALALAALAPAPAVTILAGLGVSVTTLLALRSIGRTGQRLAHHRRLFREVLEGSTTGRLVTDDTGAMVLANHQFMQVLSQAPEEAAAGSVDAAEPGSALRRLRGLFADDAEAADRLSRLEAAALAGSPASTELPLRRDPARPSWVLVEVRPVAGFRGHVHWRVEDVTSRREIDQVIREEQANLNDFMDHAPIGFYSVDENGLFLFVNATLASWLDSEPHEMMDGRLRIHDVLAAPPRHGAAYDLFEDRRDRGDVIMQGLKGRRFQASITQSLVRGEDGRMERTRSVVRDLTPEREWREALRQSEQRFQRFFEEAPIGIVLIDDQLKLLECNPAFVTMVDRPLSQILGRAIVSLVEPEGRAAMAQRLSETMAGADMVMPIEIRLPGSRPSHRELVAQVYARRFGGSDGQAGLILHFIDLTERKSLEAQFTQSQKMQAIGQLAGGVAHDFNNLLTAMIGFCDLLLLRHKPGDHSFSDIMQIKQNANRAANLVRQLLAFSRQQTLQPRVLNITDVLAELSNLLRRLIGENMELRMIHGRDLGLVKVDQGQLEQVIINLAVNARDAMQGGGKLTVITNNLSCPVPVRRAHEEMPAGDYVTIEVIDTGIGIPPENMARIFEPFFSTKEVGSGTGLGLSTVYGIVRQTGGFVFVDSAPGEGAKFTIILPRHQDGDAGEAQAEQPERQAGDLTGTGTVLLVEDEDAVRVFSARALRNKGYQVLEARSGEAALALLGADARIDLVITDVVMPQMDGPTLIRQVRASRPGIKVIFISGYTEDRFRDHLDGGESVHFLAKPFSLKQLAGKVKEVLRPAR